MTDTLTIDMRVGKGDIHGFPSQSTLPVSDCIGWEKVTSTVFPLNPPCPSPIASGGKRGGKR